MIDIEELRLYCLAKPAVTECFPFDNTNLVFKVMDKMFLLMPLDTTGWLSMKCDPERALELRERFDGIRPAWHFNKKYWNQVSLQGDVEPSLVKELIDHSYNEVVRKLTRRQREELSALADHL